MNVKIHWDCLHADAANWETATLRQQPEYRDVRGSTHSTRRHDGQCIDSHKLFRQVEESTGNWYTHYLPIHIFFNAANCYFFRFQFYMSKLLSN